MKTNSSTRRFLFALLFGAFLPVSTVANFLPNPNAVAKFGVALGGVQGLANVFVPKANLEQYGWEATPQNMATVKAAGTAALSTTAMHLQLLINKCSIEWALATGILVRMVFVTDYILRGHDKLIGTKRNGTLIWLALNALAFIELVFSPEGSYLNCFVVKIVSLVAIITGAQMAFDPVRFVGNDNPIVSLEFGLLLEAFSSDYGHHDML